jgi:uncharacterized integral membrane protein
MLDKVRPWIGWILISLLVLFIVFNLREAKVHLLLMEVTMPTALLIVLSAALGAGAVFAFSVVRQFRAPSKEAKEASKR